MFYTDELIMVDKPRVWPAPSGSGKYYVACRAFPADGYEPTRSYYLHSDEKWHQTTIPDGYFPDETSALNALASATMRPSLNMAPLEANLYAAIAAARKVKHDYRSRH